MDRIERFFPKIEQQAEAPADVCPYCGGCGVIMHGDRAVICYCSGQRERERRLRRAGLSPHLAKMTFDTFDLSYYSDSRQGQKGVSYREGAALTVAAARHFAEAMIAGQPADGMLLEGDVGVGKTHIAAACANALALGGVDVCFAVVPDLLDEIRQTYGHDNSDRERQLLERVKTAPVLVLDDLGAHNYTEWSVRTLYAVVNYRVNYELPIIVTTNLSAEEREQLLGARLNSRLVESCRHYRLKATKDIRYAKRQKK